MSFIKPSAGGKKPAGKKGKGKKTSHSPFSPKKSVSFLGKGGGIPSGPSIIRKVKMGRKM